VFLVLKHFDSDGFGNGKKQTRTILFNITIQVQSQKNAPTSKNGATGISARGQRNREN
jgi:hypothetical protein